MNVNIRGLFLSLSVAAVLLANAESAKAEPFAYVVQEEAGGRVFVIDTTTDTVLAPPITVSGVPNWPWSAISPDGKVLYVVARNSNIVSVVDTTIRQEIDTITGFNTPDGMAITPDGTKAYVGEPHEDDPDIPLNRLAIVDLVTNTVTGHVTGVLGAAKEGIAFTPDGALALVAAHPFQSFTGDRGVTVVDVATDTAIDEILLPAGSRSRGLAILPDGSKAYVAIAEGPNAVAVIDVASRSVAKIISGFVTPVGVAVTPDGHAVYVTNLNGSSVSVIDTATDTVSATVTGFVRPFHIAITPDGAKVYVTEHGNGTVAVIDAATNTFDGTRLAVDAANPVGIVIGAPLAPSVVSVGIDIHPGSFPNPINLGSGGTTPVAILGDGVLDLNDIDVATLTVGTEGVKTVGKTDKALCSFDDVSGPPPGPEGADDPSGVPDGVLDLLCHFITVGIVPEEGDTKGKVSGDFLSGGSLEGTDSLVIVP